jgi:hypothetical protein
MNMNFQSNLLNHLKDNYILIFDETGVTIGYIEMLTHNDLENDELINKFTKWRDSARDAFFTSFQPTAERTRNWLATRILADENRAFFKIMDKEKILIGHVCIINRGTYLEYDNVLKGEIVDIKGFMLFFGISFIKFLTDHFNPEYIFAQCLSNNYSALKLYEKTGFIITKKIPVRKSILAENETRWIEDPTNPTPDVYCLDIQLTRKNFSEAVHRANLENIYLQNSLLK